MEVLAAKNPEAAGWWRTNAARMFDGDQSFVFAETCGVLIDEAGSIVPQPSPEVDRYPMGRLYRTLLVLLATDIEIPVGWNLGFNYMANPRLWFSFVISVGLTVVVVLLIMARHRARRAAELARQL